MRIDQFLRNDIEPFLRMATAEGWICDPWEFDYLLETFPEGCLVAREEGRAVAFVTAVTYDRSGWVGNLLVRRDLRGKGVGSLLLQESLAALFKADVETVWLTASTAGESIYKRIGFVTADRIKRWRGKGEAGAAPVPETLPLDAMVAIDRAGWGDTRESIMRSAAARGIVAGCRNGFLVMQRLADCIQLGPWGCADTGDAERLLDEALVRIGPLAEVFLDVPVGNVAAASLLLARGFSIRSGTTLMYLGRKPAYLAGRIFALASMGSLG